MRTSSKHTPTRLRLSRTGLLLLAATLTGVLVVDPFSLTGVAEQVARADTPAEDRAANFADALAAVPTQSAAPASEITGAWPEDAGEALRVGEVVLPSADEVTVEVPDGPDAAELDLGGMSVKVAAAGTGTSPESVTLRVEDASVADEAGVTGVLLDVVDATDGGAGEDPTVDLTVSYAGFAGLVGGDWASRLRLAFVPDCATETPNDPECRPQPLPTVNDPVAQTVTGAVPVDTPSAAAAPAALSLTAAAGSGGGSVAVTAGVAGSAGDWSQTGLPQSSTWGTSGNTGAFTWSYPLQVPAPSSGPAPELTLSYSSAVSDGRVPGANNQSGWIGEGFDLTTSYIERQYKPCSTDQGSGANNAGRDSGDLCWGPENATMVFKGAATPLVHHSGTVWRSKNDDGTRVELLTGGWHGVAGGEYWKVTTPDGTQYFFGRGKAAANGTDLKSAWSVPVYGNHSGDPCYKDAAAGGYAASRCTQVWRWNLDHVVDPSGNTMTYTYATETNAYVPDYTANVDWTPVSYTSGGRLVQIDYGTRTGSTGAAPYRVVFDAQKRCVTDRTDGAALCAGGANPTDKSLWLDTPTDLQCAASATDCGNVVPVFFDTTRLAKVTAQAWDGGSYQNVDSWAFTQRFVGEGDAGGIEHVANISLRLESVTRTGHAATATASDDITLPAVQFTYTALANRVDSVTDGQSALWRHRVIRVRTESGGAVHVSYRTECDPATVPGITDAAQAANTKLCYLVKWQPEGELAPQNHWFHKYVVDSIVEDGAPHVTEGSDLITGSLSKVTRYQYLGGATWAKPTGPMIDPAEATYTDFRGYAQVATVVGETDEQSTPQRTTYFRGTGATLTAGPLGHTVTDRTEYAGMVFATTTWNGATKVSETVNQPAPPVTVATGTGVNSTRIPATTSYGFTYDAAGALVHRTSTKTSNDEAGLPVTVEDLGDLTTTSDDLCTKIAYRRDSGYTAANMLSYATSTQTYAAACTGTLTAATLTSRDIAAYDTAGRVTETRTVNPEDPTTDVTRSRATYDTAGRVLTVEDAAGYVTTTAYTASAGGQVAKVTTTSPDPDGAGPVPAFTTTQVFNPLTGLPTSSTDPNGQVTTATYDALGRPTSVRYPEHASTPKPSIEYVYVVTANGLNAVATRTLGADGNRQHTSVVLYDGMTRPFQSQVEGTDATAADPGRMVSHVYHDSAGRKVKQTAPWWAQGAPATAPITPIAVPPAQTTYEYDQAGRVTDETLWDGTDSNPDNEKWRTRTVYDGATTLTIPPLGGTPTETVEDARGRVIELSEYVRDPDTHAAATTPATVRALTSQTTGYAYDATGQLVAMTNPTGDDWSYTYDLAGQQVAATDPDSGTTTTTYDLLGRVLTRTNGNGDTLAYTYDPLGRVTTLRDDSTTGTIRAAWAYDTSDLAGGTTALGQLSSATRYVAGREFTTNYPAYDAAYRPTRVDTALATDAALHALSGQTFSTEYAYTADGQLAQVTYPQVTTADGSVVLGREVVTTRFDDASRPSWMSGGFGWGTYVAAAAWTADGRPRAHDLGNTYGAVVTYAWDEVTRDLTGITLNRERVDGADVNIAYRYDRAGNVTSIIDTPTSPAATGQADAQCFAYDGLRRLQEAWTSATEDCDGTPGTLGVGGVAPYWTALTYDELGNRTSRTDHAGSTVTSTEYVHGADGAGPHQLTEMTETTGGVSVTTGFGWDAAGNQISRTAGGDTQDPAWHSEGSWDAEGELVGITGSGGDTVNVFDASGNRLVRIDETGATVFLPGGQEVHATDTTVTASRWYTFAGSTVAVRTGVGLAGVASVVTDAHGTPVATVPATDPTAAVERLRAEPFGAARAGQDGTVAGRGFLGAPADPTGLVLLGARFYDPTAGVFLSVDPELNPGVPAQFNAYVYAGNNPFTWADPSGRSWMTRMQADTRQPDLNVHHCDTRHGGCYAQAFAENGKTAAAEMRVAQKRTDDLIPVEIVSNALGMVPVFGEAADFFGAMLSLAQGDYVGAGFSAIAMIPIIGWAGSALKASRLAAKSAKASDAANTAGPSRTLFHYTDDEGLEGILRSGELRPSLKANNPKDARYGDGQYVSDIAPGTKTCAQLSRCFIGQPFQGQRFKNYVEIDVSGLNVLAGRDGVFVIPGQSSLNLTGRIVGWGAN